MRPLYKFFLYVGDMTETPTEVHPVWKDDLSLEYTMETGQWFHRSQLSGTVDLILDDFDLVMDEDFGTLFYLDIRISDNGAVWSNYWRGKFTLTDCKVDVDHKRLTVKAETVDIYTDILAGMEREFDLIKLTPVIERIQLQKRPCLQIYDTASNTVSCIFSNLSFEQEASVPDTDIGIFLLDRCHFEHIRTEAQLHFTDIPWPFEEAFTPDFNGNITGDGSVLTNSVDTYFIRYFEESYGELWVNGFEIISRAQPDDVKWRFVQSQVGGYPDLPASIEFQAQHAPDPNLTATLLKHGIYSRIVCNTPTVGGVDTFKLENDDILPYNRNYKRVVPWDAGQYIVTTDDRSEEPTKYGVDDDGYYYVAPGADEDYIPVGQNLWGERSIWYQKNNSYQALEADGTELFWLNDAFPLWSCIDVILKEIAPEIKFSNTSDFSMFLYSGADPIQLRDNRLYLTPKSNITNGQYQTPAQKAPVTLKQIFDMLSSTYRCYWFIEYKEIDGVMQYCLRIEHVKFFLNGGSYSAVPGVAVDLTASQNVRNGKAWDYCTNSYEYEKQDMPERYQFEWMDDVTEFFKGQPIEVVSHFVEEGKVEEINVANFTSDLDYMMLNPGTVNPDGFALMNVADNLEGLYVPIITFYVGLFSYRAQNAYLSFHMLQWAYWPFNMPSKHIRIEGDDLPTSAVMVQKGKKQTVSVPLGIADPDMRKVIRTGLGNGMIYQMSIRLTSRMAKTQLRYDTE